MSAVLLLALLALLLGVGAAQAQDTDPPEFSSAAVNGTALTVTFDENLDTSSLPAGSAFTVSGGRTGTGTVSVSGGIASVTLDTAVAAGETVTVSYAAPGTNPLQDAAGNDVDDFSGEAVTNNTPAPKLVANTGQSQDTYGVFKTTQDMAQKFTTGGKPGGYKLARVDLRLQNGGSGQPDYAVTVRTDSSDAPNAAALGTLTTTDTWPNSYGLVSFNASGDGISLDANTDYWLVIDVSNGRESRARMTRSSSEDSGAAAGWSIGNATRRVSDTGTWTHFNRPMQLALYGTGAATGPPAFSSAAVNGTALTVTFDENLDTSSLPAGSAFTVSGGRTGTGTVSVSGGIASVTLDTAVAAGETVTVSYAAPGTNPLQDAAGNDVADFSGEAVTNNTPVPKLVANTGQSQDNLMNFATSRDAAQKFTTGSNSGGYKLTRVDVRLQNGGAGQPDYTVTVRTDSSGTPSATALGTLTNATWPDSYGLVTFNAAGDGISLAGSTDYWLVIDATNGRNGLVRRTDSTSEDTGAATGWSIDDNFLRRDNDSSAWRSITRPMQLAVYGTVGGGLSGPADTDPPEFSSAAVNGTALTVTFDENLDTNSLPAGSAFTVSGGRTGTGTVSVNGAVASVTLDTAVAAGETVTVSYAAPASNPLQDAAGNDVADFSGEAVTNNTPVPKLVANTGQSQDNLMNFATSRDAAQKFTTGSNSGGYKLTRVDVRLQNGGAGQPDYTVTVRTDSSGTPSATALGTLTNATWPDSYGLVTFNAAGDGISLAGSTDYWLVIDATNGRNGLVRRTDSTSEDTGAATGWSIDDNFLRRDNDSSAWRSITRPMQLAVYGTVGGGLSGPADTDPPEFSSAAVNGTALTVTFDENLDTNSLPAGSAFTVSGGRTGTGTVSVNGAVASVTLDTAVAAGETVTVSYAAPASNPLQDAAGNDVADFSGEAVTNNTPVPKLVANTGQSQDNLMNFATSRDAAQKFTTGSNSGGYKLTRVDVRLQNGGAGQPDYTVTVRTDSSGTPSATALGTLTNATWPDSYGLVTFNAAGDGISLAGSTDYWLVIDATNGRNGLVRRTDSTSEDTGAATGWSIDDNFLRRDNDSSAWRSITRPMQLAVYGTVGGGLSGPADTDPPEFSSAAVNGTALTVTFDENLDTNSLPAGSAFTVSGGRTGTGTVSVNGAVASVTLDTAVAAGETVTVSYAAPASNPLQDIAGNDVEDFSGEAVTNNTPITPGILVSTTGRAQNSTGTGRDFAQQFTTGGNAGGYKLTRVDVRVRTGGGGSAQPTYTATIRTDSSGAPNSTALGTLSNPSWPASWGLVTLTAPDGGISLDVNTPYWLVIDVTGGTNGEVRRTVTDTEDPGGAVGWSIANGNRYRADDSSSWTGQSHTIQLAVYGLLVNPPPVMSIAGGAAVTEGGNATFTVTASPVRAAPITVNLTIGQTGNFVAAGDLGSKTVTVGASGSATYSVPTVDDGNDESSGSVTAIVDSGTATYLVHATDDEASVTVNDNDDALPPVVSVARSGSAVDEGGVATFVVTSSPPPLEDLTVNLTILEDRSFVAAGHLGSQTVTVTTSGSATYRVATVDDDDDEGGGTVWALVGTGAGYDVHPSLDGASVSVSDNDEPPAGTPVVRIGRPNRPIDEGGSATFTLRADPGPTSALTVNMTVKQLGDCVAAGDRGPNTVTVGTGGSATYTVATVDDTVDEPGCAVQVELAAGTGYGLDDTVTSGWAGVEDNDNPPAGTTIVSISDGPDVNEGASASFAVTASPAPTSDLTVKLVVTETGGFVARQDLGWKTVSVGTSGSATYTVATVDDSYDEPDGVVTTAVAPGTGYKLSEFSIHGRVRVIDLEPSPAGPVVSITGGSAVTEGGSASFTVTASPAPTASISVNLTVGQTGSFVAAGDLGSNTVSVGTSGSATYTVATVDDGNDEATGWVLATVGTGTGYSVHKTNDEASVTVNDNEDAAPSVVRIAGGSAVTEGGSASFTVTASPAPAAPITVNLTIGQTGSFVAAGDLGSTTVTVGTSGSAAYTVATVDDGNDEASGSVTATVGTGTGYSVHNTQSVASVTVNDNDAPPPGTPEVSIAAGAAVTEGGGATFAVTASPAPAPSITVNLTIGQTGSFVAAGDLGSTTVTVGTSGSATYTVATVDDGDAEASGSVTATVGTGTGYSVHGTQGVASVTVNDNDGGAGTPTDPQPPRKPDPLQLALWTDKPAYRPGETIRLYHTVHPHDDHGQYRVFAWLEPAEGEGRRYLAPLSADGALHAEAVDIRGLPEHASRARSLPRADKALGFEGEGLAPGLWRFVLELRPGAEHEQYEKPDEPLGTRRAWASFTVTERSLLLNRRGFDREIRTDLTLRSDTLHYLGHQLFVQDGATLTIEPGTVVRAWGRNTAIIIEPGGRIVAEGTREAPVVLTCSAPVGQRKLGCWGGLRILGRGPVTRLEGVAPGVLPAERPVYGGTDAEGSGGVLRYVRVEFAGASGDPEVPGPAIGLYGAGSGTVLDHVQARASLGDGFAFHGGTAVCGHCVASGSGNAGLSWERGWRGGATHLYVQHGQGGVDGLAGANDDQGYDLEPRSLPTLSNVTLVHARPYGRRERKGVALRLSTGSGVRISDLLATRFLRAAIEARGRSAWLFHEGESSVTGALLWLNGAPYLRGGIRNQVDFIAYRDPKLRDVRDFANPDPRPKPDSLALHDDGEGYIGAFGRKENWLEEWTVFGPESVYDLREVDDDGN